MTAVKLWTTAFALTLTALTAEAALPDFFEVETGWMSGMTLDPDGGTRAYLGIPYAAPPTGDRRWKPPALPESWAALYEAIEYGPACPQRPYPERSFYHSRTPPEETDEDCLYLNVWTAAATADEQRPVMVWIHGGGSTRGSGANPYYDGTALANKGVVVVTMNYRLGVLGFLAHPALSAESEHGVSGNYAYLDQIAALGWVRRNIAQFGGDPENVTVFGESAGARAVSSLLTTSEARGLFHRAIAQSGAQLDGTPTLAEAAIAGEELIASLGASDLESMRRLSVDALMDAAAAPGAFQARANVDGRLFVEPVGEAFAGGRQLDVPVLLGSNADEGTALVGHLAPETWEAFEANARTLYGSRAGLFLRLYSRQSEGSARDAFLNAYRDRRFTCRMQSWASASNTAYLYYFTRVPPQEHSERYGAYHAAEIGYVFGTSKHPEAKDAELIETISSYCRRAAGDKDRSSA